MWSLVLWRIGGSGLERMRHFDANSIPKIEWFGTLACRGPLLKSSFWSALKVLEQWSARTVLKGDTLTKKLTCAWRNSSRPVHAVPTLSLPGRRNKHRAKRESGHWRGVREI